MICMTESASFERRDGDKFSMLRGMMKQQHLDDGGRRVLLNLLKEAWQEKGAKALAHIAPMEILKLERLMVDAGLSTRRSCTVGHFSDTSWAVRSGTLYAATARGGALSPRSRFKEGERPKMIQGGQSGTRTPSVRSCSSSRSREGEPFLRCSKPTAQNLFQRG